MLNLISNLVPKLICFRSVIELSNNNTILAEDTGEAFPDAQEATEPVETPAGDLIVFEETESCVKSSSDSEERESPATGRKESPSPEEPPCVKTEDKEIEMADQEASNGATAAATPQDLPEGEEIEKPKKSQKPKEPPVTFREFEVSNTLLKLSGELWFRAFRKLHRT